MCLSDVAAAAVVTAVGDDKITVSLQRRALPDNSAFELVCLSMYLCLFDHFLLSSYFSAP